MSRRFVFAGLFSSLLIALTGMVPFAFAQSEGEGLLSAVAYRPLPTAKSIRVQAMDNSDQNIVLQKEFERALQAKGFAVSGEASLVLTFETRDDVGAWSNSGRRSFLELEGRGGRTGGEDAKARLNLYDSNRGGMLNEGRGETVIMTPSQYRIDVSVDDRRNGKRLWQAWSTGDLGISDPLDLTKAMVPVLVGSLGQTVKRRAFTLP